MGAKLYGGTYIGKKCVVAGEVKNSIVMDYANKGHEGLYWRRHYWFLCI